jgi:peptide/nickel transport system ATP-binding protein
LRHSEISQSLSVAPPPGQGRRSDTGATESEARQPLVKVDNLRKVFARARDSEGHREANTALRGVSFSIHAGESVGIVGESGSGKTTLARCLLGLEAATDGMVTISGNDVTRFRRLGRQMLRETRATVQCVFQNPYASLNPSHRISHIIGEAIRRSDRTSGMHTDDIRIQVSKFLDQVGLPTSYASRKPEALSGGERQRVGIARALAMRPQLIICDEPVAALDVSVQAQVLEVLREVQQTGVALLFITHDLAVVRQMTDRVIVLRRGEVVEAGRTEHLLDRPTHPYTRALVEAVPSGSAEWLGNEALLKRV